MAKYPNNVPATSTSPVARASRNVRLRLIPAASIGAMIIIPSGTFCSAIPAATRKRVRDVPCSKADSRRDTFRQIMNGDCHHKKQYSIDLMNVFSLLFPINSRKRVHMRHEPVNPIQKQCATQNSSSGKQRTIWPAVFHSRQHQPQNCRSQHNARCKA